jgi:hypothetical protein
MYKDVLRAIAGIDTFPIISLVLFVTTFTLVVLWALRMDRESADRLAALPLDTSDAKGDCRGA